MFLKICNAFYNLQYHYCHSRNFAWATLLWNKIMRWTHGTHTSSYDISTTCCSDSKLKMNKQGSFFINLIDCFFKNTFDCNQPSNIKLIQRPQTQQHSLQYQSRTLKNEIQSRYFHKPKTDLHYNGAKWLCC